MQLNELLSEVDRLKHEIDQLRPLRPEVEHRIMQKFRLDWNYHSNAIEGNSLTLGETRAFLMEGLTASGKPLKDHLDIKGHNELIKFLELFIQRKDELTEAAIRAMHKILLREPYEAEAVTLDNRIIKKLIKLGEYKETPNFVRTGAGEIHQYASPMEVAPKMAELVAWHRRELEKPTLHPVQHAARFHHQFLEIHPFDDGNGRLARILMNLILMREGLPPVIIKLPNRDSYIAALRQADVGEKEALATLIACEVIASESLFIRGARGGRIEEEEDIEREIALFKQELSHIEETLPLSCEIQERCITDSIWPLADRIERRLQLFDELFAERSVTVAWNAFSGQQLKSSQESNHWVEYLLSISQEEGALIQEIFVSFVWVRFKQNHLNAFDQTLTWSIKFEELQFFINKGKNNPSNLNRRYPQRLSEDEISTFSSHLAECVLSEIKQKLHK